MNALSWYHTIDLGNGMVTPGLYDHRPYLPAYGLPHTLQGKTALDIGAASGFFAFEMANRGARVTATELPNWSAHDLGPLYKPDMSATEAQRYLDDPFLFANRQLGNVVERQELTIYDITPERVGLFDLVFCGSVLVHVTDPIKALWNIRSVTREAAIIATVIHPSADPNPMAYFVGHYRGDAWWHPNRAGLEALVASAGFAGWEWFSSFRLDYRDGSAGPYHAVIRAWNTEGGRPALLDDSEQPPTHLRTIEQKSGASSLPAQLRSWLGRG